MQKLTQDKLKKKLQFWLRPKKYLFKMLNSNVLDRHDNTRHRVFIDRNSDVLFVAHMDTVCKPKLKYAHNKKIFASGLDDRLGCMLAYELSEELQTDLLLTDHEESFCTTAQFHACKKYNWIVEFDRRGTDVVTYGLDSDEFVEALSEYWIIGMGSYSDICDLDTEACCFNLGIGYEKAHSSKSYVVKKNLRKQIEKFRQFYEKYKDTEFIREPELISEPDSELLSALGEIKTAYDANSICDACGIKGWHETIYGYTLCEDCVSNIFYQYCEGMEK